MIALYARVSTAEQAQEGYSIDEQIVRLEKYCEAQGRLDFVRYVDGGFTGANTKRPALQDMIRDVAAGKIDKVLVYKLDRLSRSQKDTLELIEDVFLANGCDFESMTERFDTGTSFGRAMVGILAVFAQLEREQIKERMGLGKEGRAKEGKYHGGGHSPYGYDYTDGELVINEDEARMVREIFRLFNEGWSIKKIEKKKGYQSRVGGALNSRTIKGILTNNIYVGMIKHKGEVFEGQHEHIISDELFAQTQEKMRIYQESVLPVSRHGTLLGGLMYCRRCGAKYACCSHGMTADYRYYSCYSRRKVAPAMIIDPNCNNKHWRVETLDGIICDEIKKLSLDPEALTEIIMTDPVKNDDQEELIRSEIKKIDEQCSRFLDLYGLGKWRIEQLNEKTDQLNARREKLQAELDQIERENSTRLKEPEARKLISSFSDILESGTVDEIRLVIQTLIDKIELDGEDIFIRWRF